MKASKAEENASESKPIHKGMVSYFDLENQELVHTSLLLTPSPDLIKHTIKPVNYYKTEKYTFIVLFVYMYLDR